MRPHRFEATSLIFGLIFTGFGVWFLTGEADIWRLDWEWVWPVALLAAAVMVLASLRPRDTAELDAADDTPSGPDSL